MTLTLENRALSAIERRIKFLEEKGEGLFSPNEVVNSETISSNIEFVRQLEIINEQQAREFTERILALEEERKLLERTETRDIVNDFENPLERERRFLNIDKTARDAQNLRNARVNRSQNTDAKITTSITLDPLNANK